MSQAASTDVDNATLSAGAIEVMYKTALRHTGLITDSLSLLTELNAPTIGGC